MQTYIFDFNGTIMDDRAISIRCMNRLIKAHLGRPLLSESDYLSLFTFPVKEYYARVGFAFDQLSFEAIGKEWMDYYDSEEANYRLMPGAEEFLLRNKAEGKSNVLLSASRQDKLERQCALLGISELFDAILGIDNIYASSKEHIALDYIKDKDRSQCVMIGDTLHDLQVANKMGIECLLVSRGHQSAEVLRAAYDKVFDDIREIRI